MAPSNDEVNSTKIVSTGSARPIRLGHAMRSRPHTCAFFKNLGDDYRVLLPFVNGMLDRKF